MFANVEKSLKNFKMLKTVKNSQKYLKIMFENVGNGECSEFRNCIGKHSEQLLETLIILVKLNLKSVYAEFEIILIRCQDSILGWLLVLKQLSDSEFGAMMSMIKFLSRHFFLIFFLYHDMTVRY